MSEETLKDKFMDNIKKVDSSKETKEETTKPTETIIKTFQKKHKQSDVMGVIRTLYPNVEISILKKKGNK